MLLADKIAIAELAHRFERAFDDADLDLHMSTWSESIAFESPFGSYDTHEDYREWVSGFSEQMQGRGGTRHLITNHEISDAGTDRAKMICYLTILARKDASIMATTRFDDELVREGGAWKFSKRVLTVDQDMS